MIKKIITWVIIFVVTMTSSVFADEASIKAIGTNLSKKAATFKVKGPRGVLPGEFFNLKDKYRVNTYSYSYDTKTQTMTFNITYNTTNLNTAKPDAIVKSDEELRKFLYDYTKGKLKHTIYLTTNNTLDKTTNDMFIVKLDYPVCCWQDTSKVFNYLDQSWEANYRSVHTNVVKYNHQVQPLCINADWTQEDKDYWDKWLGKDLEVIAKKSKNEWEIIYNWYQYTLNTYVYDQERLRFDLELPSDYKPELAKPMIEDKTGVCEDYAYVSKYALSELGIPNVIRTGNRHAWNETMINGKIYYTDSTGRFYRNDRYKENVLGPSFNANEMTYEEFYNEFVLEKDGGPEHIPFPGN